MKLSRRDLAVLLPALAAAGANAQSKIEKLPSKVYNYSDLPVRTGEVTKSRSYFNGPTHTGFFMEMHETELQPGKMPHAPHRHAHEELFILSQGTVDVTVEGHTTRMEGAGSANYVASNEEHGVQNVGKTPARYYVIAIGNA
jgi:quercetin dioxygenase-like cupin family protein